MKKNKYKKVDYSYLDDYYQKGGTYVIPIEIINDIRGELEEHENCKADIEEANTNAEWWRNRYVAQLKINREYKHRIEQCSADILKELNKNNHLSYGVALSIRQKLLNYSEINKQK